MLAVSIIMPVYNVEKYIKKTIQSILAQTFKDFELIVVNDGSTDNSMAIVMDFAVIDSRIKIVNKRNEGVSAARNTGIKLASGNYICFIDSDDEVDKDLLKIIMGKSSSQNIDVLMYGIFVEKIGNNDNILDSKRVKTISNIYNRKNIKEFIIDENSLSLLGYVWNKLYDRNFLMTHQILFDENKNFLEDIEFNERVFKYMSKFMVIEDCLYHYKRRKRVSLINTFRKEDFDLQMDSIKSREKILRNWGVDHGKIQSSLAALHVYAIRSSCSNLFVNRNHLTLSNKCELIGEMVNCPITDKRIKNYQSNSIGGKTLKQVIEKRKIYTLATISFIYSVRIKLFN